MSFETIQVKTQGEKFYNITKGVEAALAEQISKGKGKSGIVCVFCPHTSCGLTISESFDPSAAQDMKNFLSHIAPRNLPFITHTSEGSDDSPSHMKSIILSPSLNLIVENGNIVMGTWQGIFLAEFRDHSKNRKVFIRYIAE